MLVYIVVMLIALLGFCGLAVDVGRVEWRTAQLQAAADAGAIAAATELQHGGSATYAQAATLEVHQYQTLNGMPITGTVTTTFPPNYGDYSSDASAVQVTVTQPLSTVFLRLLSASISSINLSVKSVAAMPPCMVFLGTPGTGGTGTFAYWSASANIYQDYGCPFYAKTGFYIDGFANSWGSQMISSTPASSTVISGGVSQTPQYGAPILPDPLAYMAAPAVGTCVNSSPIVLNNPSSQTFSPGTYCGSTSSGTTTPAVSVTGTSTSNPGGDNYHCTSNPVITLSPGLYIFTGGIYANCVTIQGTGVTMFFTKTAGGGYGKVNLNFLTWNVSAPTVASSGSIPGIVVYLDRNWVGGNQDLSIQFSSWTGDGVIYSASTGFYDWQTSMSAPNYLNIVAANMYMYNCTVRPVYNYINLPTGNPLHNVVQLVQ